MSESIEWFYYERLTNGKYLVKSMSGDYYAQYVDKKNAQLDVALSNDWYNSRSTRDHNRMYIWDQVVDIMYERGMPL